MKFPFVRKSGSAVVTIYRTPIRHGSARYDAYTLRWYADGKPRTTKRASLDDAITKADEIAESINAGTVAIQSMTSSEVADCNDAKDILAGRASLRDAARFWASHHPANMVSKLVSDAITEMLAAKRQDGLSDEWLRDLRTRLETFKSKFGAVRVCDLSGQAIDDWLRSRASGRTRNNYRGCISTLISFCKDRQYLVPEWNELDRVAVAKEQSERIEIFTPSEMRKMLDGATPKQILFLTLGGFAGIRSKEITRLDWSEIGREFVEIKPPKAKTGQRRLVPISSNLASWLRPLRSTGPVLPARNLAKMAQRIADRSGVPWRQNALRHSFISYRLALIQNTAQVALEAGNSERKIFTNYRELVTKKATQTWFSISKRISKSVPKKQHPAETPAK